MGQTISQRIVESLPYLDEISDSVQPKVQKLLDAAGGKTARNVLDGTPMELPLHPALTDVPIGAWTTALIFDGLDVVGDSNAMRRAADASLAVGVAGGIAAAITGISDWRYLSGGSRRMGAAHGLLNAAGLALSIASLGLRAAGRRNAGRLVFLAGYSLTGTAAHLGGELSYNYGLRVNRGAFEKSGPDEFTAVLPESELPENAIHRVEVDGAGILLSRSSEGEVCAISAKCNHFGGPLEEGEREGDTVVCPWHGSRFDLRDGEAKEGPATFPQSTYEARVRGGWVEVKASEKNIQNEVR